MWVLFTSPLYILPSFIFLHFLLSSFLLRRRLSFFLLINRMTRICCLMVATMNTFSYVPSVAPNFIHFTLLMLVCGSTGPTRRPCPRLISHTRLVHLGVISSDEINSAIMLKLCEEVAMEGLLPKMPCKRPLEET